MLFQLFPGTGQQIEYVALPHGVTCRDFFRAFKEKVAPQENVPLGLCTIGEEFSDRFLQLLPLDFPLGLVSFADQIRKLFQRQNGLTPDGVVGPSTLSKLGLRDRTQLAIWAVQTGLAAAEVDVS